ncbi:zinc finger protein 184-like [Argiope bruennichi]|uniref:zinc finger protein 184-like n=1 Tax=Argiope bruennichi TaxID=94029 RepID=UPI002495199C|nr:zinc finger protein 184-like [Argiope bruennichi]
MSRPNFESTTTFKGWPTNNQLNSELSNRWILNSRFTVATQEPRFTWDETMRRLRQAMEKSEDKKFRCLECLKEFYTETRYNNHRANHDISGSRLEPFRNFNTCTTEGNRGTERNVSGSRLEPFRNFNTCTTEGNRGTEGNVLPFGCQICLKTFPNTEDLQEHEKTHRWKVCPSSPGCFTKFLSKDKMEQHQQLHRPDGHPKPKPEKYRFRCRICHTNFWRKIDLKKHEKMHGLEKCGKGPSCIKELGPKVQMVHPEQLHRPDGHPKPKPEKYRFRCKICLTNFWRKIDLKKHEKMHRPEKCGKGPSCIKELGPKVQMVHPEQFHSPDGHPKPNPGGNVLGYSPMCLENFKTNMNLEEHDETHEPEICGNFSSCRKELDPKGQMVQHGQLHRPVELPKPNPGRKVLGYSPISLENFNTNMNLEEHDETHEPEICGNFSSCRKEFDPKGQMVHHGQLHRPVELPKPNPGRKVLGYSPICLENFNTNMNLEEHDETHEPETCGNFSSCRKELDPKGQMVQHGQLHRPVELPKPNPGRKGIGVEIDDDIELIQID